MGCAAIVGALVAFPAGIMFAGRHVVREKAGPPIRSDSQATKPIARNVYSPTVLNDPYVLDQHHKVVEALEAHCRNQSEHCAEAKQARQWIDRQKTSN